MFNTGNCPSVPIVANLDGNNGNNWNDGSWLWFLIVVFAIFGGWGNGFGGFGGTNGGVGSEIQRGFDNQAVVSKLDGIVDINNPKYAMVMKRPIRELAIYEIEDIDKENCKYFSTEEKAEAKLKELRGVE